MNILTFNYTKDTGKRSSRVLLPLTVPNKMYEGIDITELEDEQQVLFVHEMADARSTYVTKMAELQDKYDVKTNYRRFDPLKMSELIKEAI